MTRLGARDAFLDLLADRRERWHLFLLDLGYDIARDRDLRAPIGGGWSLADHLAHLAAWERRWAKTVRREPKGPFGDFERFNQRIYAEWRNRPDVEKRAEYEAAHEDLLAAVRALPAHGDPDRPKLLVGWNLGMAPRHYREHVGIVADHHGVPRPQPWRGRLRRLTHSTEPEEGS